MKQFKNDKLTLKIYESRRQMGNAAAMEISSCIQGLLQVKKEINMIFAAAPSQNEVLSALLYDPDIEWHRINAFHMDEYVGISPREPAGFAFFLKRALFDRVPFKSVHLLDCTADPKEEAERYSKELEEHPADIVVMGIGENGHIAFNDPHEALFQDPVLVKEVSLDPVCRMQQVHDGCFSSLELVPKTALTLTIPALARAPYHFCIVPAPSKAEACLRTFLGPIEEACPATILRTISGSILYCDPDSASEILKKL